MSAPTPFVRRYNPPPNWPPPPTPDWRPPAGWQPDPAWGPPPPGWQLWVDQPAQKKSNTTKWIVLGVTAALLLICAIGIASMGGDDDPTTAPEASEPATSEPSASEPAPTTSEPAPTTSEPAPTTPAAPGIGTAVRDGKFEFVVTGVERPGKTIGSDFLEETAQGEFIIVRMNVTNIGDEGQTLSSTGQVLYNDKGQKFEPSSAIFSLPDADKFFLENINPGNTVTGAPLLFDVPPGTVLHSIELHDSVLSGGVTVSLAGS